MNIVILGSQNANLLHMTGMSGLGKWPHQSLTPFVDTNLLVSGRVPEIVERNHYYNLHPIHVEPGFISHKILNHIGEVLWNEKKEYIKVHFFNIGLDPYFRKCASMKPTWGKPEEGQGILTKEYTFDIEQGKYPLIDKRHDYDLSYSAFSSAKKIREFMRDAPQEDWFFIPSAPSSDLVASFILYEFFRSKEDMCYIEEMLSLPVSGSNVSHYIDRYRVYNLLRDMYVPIKDRYNKEHKDMFHSFCVKFFRELLYCSTNYEKEALPSSPVNVYLSGGSVWLSIMAFLDSEFGVGLAHQNIQNFFTVKHIVPEGYMQIKGFPMIYESSLFHNRVDTYTPDTSMSYIADMMGVEESAPSRLGIPAFLYYLENVLNTSDKDMKEKVFTHEVED